jgi:hypothetical protein
MNNSKEDAEFLKEVRVKIAKAINTKDRAEDNWSVSALQYCIDLIERLQDENESLWFMLEELKESKWSKTNTQDLTKSISKRLTFLRMVQSKKGEA